VRTVRGLWFLILLLPGPALAERIYEYRDADGGVVFTDRSEKRMPDDHALLDVRKGWEFDPEPLTPAQRDRYDPAIRYAARSHDLDPALIKAVIHAESLFDADAVSSAGAEGLMQLMPETAGHLNVHRPFDPRQNILGGSEFLAYLQDRFDRLDHVLAAYNAGETNVRRHDGIPPFTETRNYVKKVKELLTDYRQQFSASSDPVATSGE
jgi:soluble lytic murein transglycosylase-like protein